MTDTSTDEAVVTVHDRLTAAGISPDRIAEHHAGGRVLLDGQPVEDLQQHAPVPARVTIGPA
jgi:hypothetical protein